MNLKAIMLAVMLAGSVTSYANASFYNGATQPDVQLVANDPSDPNYYTGFFGNSPLATGAFTDTFTFLPVLSSEAVGNAWLNNLNLGSKGNLQITSVTLNGTAFNKITNSYWELPDTLLTAGLLTLTVIGTQGVGGSYSGGINLQVTPVPEPETYGMMLGGLALLGYMARRRKQG